MEHSYWVLFIFILTYVFIAVQRIPMVRLDRPSGVMIGTTLLLLIGLVDIHEAYSFVDWDVITFLLGMMVMISYLEFSGFFEHVALWLVRKSRSTERLLLSTIFSSAANLIVAEKAQEYNIQMGFFSYFKVGLSVTLSTVLFGTYWLYIVL